MKIEYKNFGRVKISAYIYYVIMREIKTKTMKKEMFPFAEYKSQWVEIVKNAIEEDADAIELGYDQQLKLIPLCKNLHDLYKVNEEFGWWDVNNYQEMRKLVSFE